MRASDLFKLVPVAAIALCFSTSALGGATNRDENTAATPGEKATTTKTPADGDTGRKTMRRGTTNTGDTQSPTKANDASTGSGSAGSSGSQDKSMQHDKSSDKDASMSGSSGGGGELSNAGGWDPNNPGEYPVTVR